MRAGFRAGRQPGQRKLKGKSYPDPFLDEEIGIFRQHRFQQAKPLFEEGDREEDNGDSEIRGKGEVIQDESDYDIGQGKDLEGEENSSDNLLFVDCLTAPERLEVASSAPPIGAASSFVSISTSSSQTANENVAVETAVAKSASSKIGFTSKFLSGFNSLFFGNEEEEEKERRDAVLVDPSFPPLIHSSSIFSSYTIDNVDVRSIRFQVIIWHVGRPDEVLGRVDMKFRVTIFWNSPSVEVKDTSSVQQGGYGSSDPFNRRVWTMYGRQRAYQRELAEISKTNALVYVPPVSILNAVNFDVLDGPEVCLIKEEKNNNLMRWSCLYRADLLQEDMNVSNFPHDSHFVILRLGILKHRQSQKRWDKQKWKLDLATSADVQDTVETPHGSIVDHVIVPGFQHDKEGLEFEFLPLALNKKSKSERDNCLQIKLKISRESSYYDRNIIPLLAALNLVAISTLTLDPSYFGARGEMILATAFVEIGIRLTVDSRLPVVGYQIKIQNMLDHSFYGLLLLVIESSVAYCLQYNNLFAYATRVDQAAAIIEMVHLVCMLTFYYSGLSRRHMMG